jgi:hypothetical protein
MVPQLQLALYIFSIMVLVGVLCINTDDAAISGIEIHDNGHFFGFLTVGCAYDHEHAGDGSSLHDEFQRPFFRGFLNIVKTDQDVPISHMIASDANVGNVLQSLQAVGSAADFEMTYSTQNPIPITEGQI